MSENNKILIKIPFDRSKGEPAPSFEQFGVFYREFGRLLKKKDRQNSEVYFEDGSIKIWLIVGQLALFDLAPSLISCLTNPQNIKDQTIATNIHNSLNGNSFKCSFIEINNEKVKPKDYSEELKKMQTIKLAKYRVISHKISKDEEYDETDTPHIEIKKCIATIEFSESGENFKQGDRIRFETDAEFCERNVVYIASFVVKMENSGKF